MSKNAASAKHAARKFAVVDCETTSFLHGRVPKPYLWGYYDGVDYVQFEDTQEFVDFIGSRKQVIYAHNGGKFDYHFLLDHLNVNSPIMLIDGRIVKAELGLAELRDSWNILPVPLRAYKKDDFDYSVLEDDKWRLHFKELSEYLKNDCIYLYELIKTQRDDYGAKLTLAGSAMATWSSQFGGTIPNTPRSLFDRIQPYYYGGRVECFEKGIIKGPFHVYDINSAYPYAMLHKHPWGEKITVSETLPVDGRPCFVTCYGVSTGAFPVRNTNKSLSFPNDDEPREFHVTGWEFAAANELGLFKGTITQVVTFAETIEFSAYVNHFFDMKAKMKGIDDARYLLAKLYMNSLYGKFGQNSEDHLEYKLGESNAINSHILAGYDFCGEVGPNALFSQPVPEDKQRYYNLATAASITGFVRAELLRHITTSKGVIYCDTDSIACRTFRGSLGKQLGQWSCEGDFDTGAVAGKKLYAFRVAGKTGWDAKSYKIATKGVKLTAKEIFDVANGKTVLYKNQAPTFSLTNQVRFLERSVTLT